MQLLLLLVEEFVELPLYQRLVDAVLAHRRDEELLVSEHLRGELKRFVRLLRGITRVVRIKRNGEGGFGFND